MKKIWNCLSAVLFMQSASVAQMTFTSTNLSNLFAPGKSWMEYTSNQNGITMDVGITSNAGAQTWTFPSVVFTDSSRMDNVLPSATPYSALFAGAEFAQKSHGTDGGFSVDMFQFFSLSNDSLFTIGEAQHYTGSTGTTVIDTSLVSHGMEFDARIPVQLGNVIQGISDTSNLGGGFTQIKTTVETYDAFGTLNLPNGSFQALRSKKVETTNVYNGTTLINSYSQNSFTWLTAEGHRVNADADTGGSSGVIQLSSISVTYLISTPVTVVDGSPRQPREFSLSQNYPNPFNPTTNIQFSLRDAGFASIKVFDMLGREAATVVSGEMSAGTHTVSFDAQHMTSGVYMYQLRSGTTVETKRMILLK